MLNPTIACCYFPTTTLFIDDNERYLRSLRTRLSSTLAYKFYTDPIEALHFFHDDYQPTSFINKWVSNLKDSTIELGSELEENELTHAYTDVNVAEVHKELYNADRFNEVSLVVIDYAMPKLNGIDFCESIKHLPVKKLMITGQAGYDIGVDALNEKLIDKFLVKDTLEFRSTLNTTIASLQHQYFHDQSATVLGNLTTTPRCCLSDPEFINFFTRLRDKLQIFEYYLVTDSGSMLLVDINGKASWLAIESKESIEKYHDLVVDSDGPEDISKALANKKQMLFLMNKEDEYIRNTTDWNKWRKRLNPANELIGANNTYYYALIEDTASYGIDPTRITGYQSYLEKS